MSPDEVAAVVFIDVAVIVVVARLMAALFKRIRQPAVVGEILAGLALGPSLLGTLPGNLPEVVFPTEVRPYLGVLAQLGLIIFMFIVGLELDIALVRGKERVAGVISVSSVALPFGLGVVLAMWLFTEYPPTVDSSFVSFALFIGASMSITAFPVLARILAEREMHRTEVGAIALACAAVDDILAWSLLALVLALQSSSTGDLPLILVESMAFIAVMFLVVRPRLTVLTERYRRAGRLTPGILAVVVVGFLVCAFLTALIGIHAIFGAFLFGVIMPRVGSADLFREILERLEQISVLLLLPVFFILTGLNTNVSALRGGDVVALGAVLLVACSGKFFGAAGAARATGLRPAKAAAIGILMNTRGLTELVILNIGRERGVLNDTLFTILVIMAVFTTVITEPLLRLVYPDRLLKRDIAEADRGALRTNVAFRVLVSIGDPKNDDHLIDTAVGLVGGEDPAEIVLTHLARTPASLEVGTGLTVELAELADTLTSLQMLARRAEGRGVACSVRARFSDDIGRDLVAQAVAVGADVVLLPSPRDGPIGQGVENAPSLFVTLIDPTQRAAALGTADTVLVWDPRGADGMAACEVGLRLVRSAGATLHIAAGGRDGRRLARTVQRLDNAGVRVSVGPVPSGGVAAATRALNADAVVVAPAGVPKLGVPVFAVQGPPAEDTGRLDRFVQRISDSAGSVVAST